MEKSRLQEPKWIGPRAYPASCHVDRDRATRKMVRKTINKPHPSMTHSALRQQLLSCELRGKVYPACSHVVRFALVYALMWLRSGVSVPMEKGMHKMAYLLI